ncbi:LOW QUALITY PROTEIN: uncharacterized protein LOC119591037 [Penaeus monodon]|uniref:LOW QUALITY PROTEIN: uncharacterized protein LOC119591037 n=1 Tax=Penaeus monodon TaxID=6687 RepID=UPI0018A76DCB|nr:LOW QUALITY PROTEIN: uncharacterized protein LOC119591037 [Penaeus monodon]
MTYAAIDSTTRQVSQIQYCVDFDNVVKLKCVLGLCVAALLAIKVTLVSIYWQRNSGPHHGFDGRVSDWGNGAADSARRVSECRSMFEMNSDEKRISRDTNHYEDLGVALPFHPRHRGASQSPSGTPGPRALGAEDPDPRASSTGGRLLYLPCQLQEYGPELTLDCMRARLGRGRKLWILFAGDSKIRNTFLSFLNLTRVMEYNVSFLNTSGSLGDLTGLLNKRYDLDTVSTVIPNLRFCTFLVRNFSSFEYNSNVLLLKRMADGVDPVPDLLVTGYSTWTLAMTEWGSSVPRLFVMDRVREGVRRLALLFHRLSLRTRVLVLSESRVKPFAGHFAPVLAAVFSDSNIEWINMMFFHYLREVEGSEDREGRSSLGARAKRDWLKADSKGLWWWDSLLPHGLAVRALCAELHADNLTLTSQYGRLRCNDTNHVGETTLQVRATTLLNLVCNTAVTLQADNVCC